MVEIKMLKRLHCFLEAVEENPSFCLFRHLEAPFIHWLYISFPCSKPAVARQVFFRFYHSDLDFRIYHWFWLLFPLSYIRKEWLNWPHTDNAWDSSYLATSNLITVVKSLLPCKVAYLQVPGVHMWTPCVFEGEQHFPVSHMYRWNFDCLHI